MSDIPDRIYVTSHGETNEYHRVTECVWKKQGHLAFGPHSYDTDYLADEVSRWNACPYCGGKIRVEEG